MTSLPRLSPALRSAPATATLTLLFAGLAPAPGASQDWELAAADRPVAGTEVVETRWRLKRGPQANADTIQVHRYRVDPGDGVAPAVLLHLPGTNMNGQVAVADPEHNLWLFLAQRGVEVFTLDYRTHFLTRGALQDPAALREWSLAVFVDDAVAAAELALRESGRSTLFIAGFSRGVTLAYAMTSRWPADRLAGLVLLDGYFKSHEADGDYDLAAALASLEESGRYASDVAAGIGWERRDQLMRAASADPRGPALGSEHSSVGEQVADILYRAWGEGGLANPKDGVSRVDVLARLLQDYDRYYPAIQTPQGASIADHLDDPATPLDDGWGELDVPVLHFGSTGMGPRWVLDGIYSAAKSGSPDVELHLLEGYGHLDVLVGERAREEVFQPIHEWIEKHSR